MTLLTGWRLAALGTLKKSLLHRRFREGCEMTGLTVLTAATLLTKLALLTPRSIGSTRSTRSPNPTQGAPHV
jgi:hypothetical protein